MLPIDERYPKKFAIILISIFFTEFIGMVSGLFSIAGIDSMNADAAVLVSISTVILISFQSVSYSIQN